MRLMLFMALSLGLLGCSGPKRSEVKFGLTTAAQLKESKGEPVSLQSLDKEQVGQVLVYPKNEKFQINKEEIVVASFRDPTENERSLLYWRHQFQGKETSFSEIKTTAESHTGPEMELKCPSLGVSVIYDPNVDAVVRVVEHASQIN